MTTIYIDFWMALACMVGVIVGNVLGERLCILWYGPKSDPRTRAIVQETAETVIAVAGLANKTAERLMELECTVSRK